MRYDLPRLGAIDGLDVVHLQCHIGTDSVSLSRLGAASVVGVDFSPAAVDAARTLAARVGAGTTFVESEVYAAPDALGRTFDLVYTGIGALCWLPDIAEWARVVATLLKPGGRLFVRDGHPMLGALGLPRDDGLLTVEYPYFESEGVVFTENVSYIGDGAVSSPDNVLFSHGLGEIFCALREAGLTVTDLVEHREAPWNPLGAAMRESRSFPGEYELVSQSERLPLTFTVQAVRSV